MSHRVKEAVLAGVRAAWWVSPVTILGGDMVECLPMGANRDAALFVLGDAMGKGELAFPTMTLVSGTLRALTSGEPSRSPTEVLQAMHGVLGRLPPSIKSRHMAMCAVAVPETRGGLVMCNAGVPACLVRSRDGVTRVASGGSPPGLFPGDPIYEEEVLDLTPRDLVVVASDGVAEHETADPPNSYFGIDELVRVVGCSRGGASEVLRTLMRAHEDALKRHHSSAPDDRSILVLEIL